MTRSLLVVTGARALDPRSGGTAASEAWAAAILYRVADELPPFAWWLSGRCPTGPDAWAPTCVGFADRQRLVEYALDGVRYVDDVPSGRWRRTPGRCVDPHERNAAMVAAAVRAVAVGWDVRVVALLCPWATTRGTVRTADRAQYVGLRVERYACPVELAP